MIPIAKPFFGKEEKKAVLKVMDSGKLAQGEKTAEFEQRFAKFVGTDFAVATTNGTQALIMILECLEKKGEILVPSFSFIASATSVIAAGCKPVFVDIEPKTFNLDLEDAKKKLSAKTVGIMPVHLFGQCCNMNAVSEWAEKNSLLVVEDACQAHGAEWNNQKAGSFGEASAFSFYPTKNITTGEGGMTTTNNKELAEKLCLYRNHGQLARYQHASLGYNFRGTEIASAIGLEQLKKLSSFIEQRRKNADHYFKNLKTVELPFVHKEAFHSFHQFSVKTEKRGELIGSLEKNKIGYGIYYPRGIHEQEVMVKRFGKQRLPQTELVSRQVLSIPVHPSLSKTDLKTVTETINSL